MLQLFKTCDVVYPKFFKDTFIIACLLQIWCLMTFNKVNFILSWPRNPSCSDTLANIFQIGYLCCYVKSSQHIANFIRYTLIFCSTQKSVQQGLRLKNDIVPDSNTKV